MNKTLYIILAVVAAIFIFLVGFIVGKANGQHTADVMTASSTDSVLIGTPPPAAGSTTTSTKTEKDSSKKADKKKTQ